MEVAEKGNPEIFKILRRIFANPSFTKKADVLLDASFSINHSIPLNLFSAF